MNCWPEFGVIVNSMYLEFVTAFSIVALPQFVALKRPELPEAVSPDPREIVEAVSPASLEFETAVVSLPVREAKSKVRICPKLVEAKARKRAKTKAERLKR